MKVKKTSAREACGRPEARARLAQAKKFVEVAAMCLDDASDEWTASAAAALCVLAGIAASDAVCWVKLKERSRGQNHHDAEKLLQTISPNGRNMSQNLMKLINEKDNAHYGTMIVGQNKAKSMLRWANNLIQSADEAMKS
jgi:hypothetical protein